MANPRFYEIADLSEGSEITLSDSCFQHAIKVLRLKEGAAITLFNGNGHDYSATLTQVSKKSAQARIDQSEPRPTESAIHSHIGQVMSRGERMDYAVQKSTEMGVNQITPLTSERCEVRLNAERQTKRINHWQQIAISACEQSGRSQVPKIEPCTPLETWISEQNADLKLVLHHHCAKKLGEFTPPASVALLIGPEGGLTEREVELARQHGFQAVAFGPRVMRTETAPVAALSILNYLWGDQ